MSSSNRSSVATPVEKAQAAEKVRGLRERAPAKFGASGLVLCIYWFHYCAHFDRVLQVSALPSSPAELLRHIQSDGYKQAQLDQAQRVQSSFEVGWLSFRKHLQRSWEDPAVCCGALQAPSTALHVGRDCPGAHWLMGLADLGGLTLAAVQASLCIGNAAARQ